MDILLKLDKNMKDNKHLAKELIQVCLLQLYCFFFSLSIYYLKQFCFTRENYDGHVHWFYITTGLILIIGIYFCLLWKGRKGLLPLTLYFKTSYIILNLIGLLYSPILIIFYLNSNFPSDVYEGVGVPLEMIGSIIWLLFWNIISFCFLMRCSFPKVLFAKSKNQKWLCATAYILSFILCLITVYHLYKGRLYIANPEVVIIYTMFSIAVSL